jgi:hypothetical protein
MKKRANLVAAVIKLDEVHLQRRNYRITADRYVCAMLKLLRRMYTILW